MPALIAAAMMAQSVAQMRDHRRVLIVATSAADDPRLRAQRVALADWRGGAADRDLSVVELVGRVVSGATDDPASLRAAYHLPTNGFAVVLIGKDGHVAYRSAEPVPAEKLQGTIDAMPMRRAGER